MATLSRGSGKREFRRLAEIEVCHAAHFGAKKPPREVCKGCRFARSSKLMSGLARLVEHVVIEQGAINIFGSLFRARYECHSVARNVREHAREQGIVRASQYQRIYLFSDQWREIFTGDFENFGA